MSIKELHKDILLLEKTIKSMIKNESKVLSHLVEHIEDIKEPIDNRDYVQSKEIISSIKKGKKALSGEGLFDTLDIKDIEKLEKVFEDYQIEKKKKAKNLKLIREGTINRVKQGVKATSKPDIRFTKKTPEDIKEYMAYIRSKKSKK